MIKECEIKVENRGMADAQGWEQINIPIHRITSLEMICEMLVFIAWDTVSGGSDGF